jgi:hypothetical protein
MAGVGTRLLTLEVEGDSATGQVSNARFTSGEADSDFVTFADAAAGGAKEYRLQGTAVQDLVADTLWHMMFTAPGTEVDVVLAPYGNALPTPTQPHLTATVVVEEPEGDMVGGDADKSTTARMTWEINWPCLARPVLVTA